MTRSDAANGVPVNEKKLPRRDWFLLPMLGLLTIALLATSTELIARLIFPEETNNLHNCLTENDSPRGVRGKPNSVCWDKFPESGATEYRFNRCGYRGDENCGPKSPETYRIVMVGSSVPMGLRVAQEQSLATLLSVQLSRQTGRQVEVYNESLEGTGGIPSAVDRRFSEVLAAAPDLILWVLTPWDIENAAPSPADKTDVSPQGTSPGGPASGGRFHQVDLALEAVAHEIRDLWSHTRSEAMLRHFLFESQSQYVRSYLTGPDETDGYLRTDFSETWMNRLKGFDNYSEDIERQAKAAGVPLVATLVPSRAQAAMISMGESPAGFDPYKLDHELGLAITSNGETFLTILPEFRSIPNPEQYYFPLDGHPDARGSAKISEGLASQLTSGAVPALRVGSGPRIALGQSR